MLPRISAATAAKIDDALIRTHGFSLDQLMELAGLAVADCVGLLVTPQRHRNVLVLAGPGNNGGDGLVASRHLLLRGFQPTIYYPKPSKSQLFDNLQQQLKSMDLPFISNEEQLNHAFENADFVVDSLFGFSFKPPVRPQFTRAIELLTSTSKPILAVDIPSSWSVESGPSTDSNYMPSFLISLTAPKQSANYFKGRHFIGGRFITQSFASEYGFTVPAYEKNSQIFEETDQYEKKVNSDIRHRQND